MYYVPPLSKPHLWYNNAAYFANVINKFNRYNRKATEYCQWTPSA